MGLSIRDAKSLNHGKLRGSLQYACRSSRPEGSPRLKALYVFGPKDVPVASLASSAQPSVSAEWNQRSQRALTAALEQEKDAWWTKKGPMQVKSHQEGWQDTLVACSGIIAFDAVLCKGPAHRNSPAFGTARSHRISEPAIASIALPPCEGCGSCPEGLTDLSTEAVNLPLLAPPPVLSSSLRATSTTGSVLRCSVRPVCPKPLLPWLQQVVVRDMLRAAPSSTGHHGEFCRQRHGNFIINHVAQA